jgi:tetratricopeptide (TPR) repeat protein
MRGNSSSVYPDAMARASKRHSPLWRRWRLGLVLPGLLFLPVMAAASAQDSNSPSPQVVQLYSEARAAQSRGDVGEAIARYKEILKLSPHLAAAYNNLGLLYYNQQNFSEAVTVLEQGLRIDPRMTASWALLGTCQFALGRYREAGKSLEQALHGNPEDAQIQMLLVRALLQSGDGAPAAARLEQWTSRYPDDQQAWYLLGKTYLQLSQQALAKVQQINPDSALAHVISGEIMEGMKNYEGALVEFQKAASIDPQQGGAEEHLANAYWELGQWTQARQAFQAELSSSPQNCSARWKAADCLIQQHADPDEALRELDKAIAQCGDVMQARVDRARVLIDLGRPSDALPDLQLALKASPDEPSIHFLLANVYRAQHQNAEAQAEMKLYAQLQQSQSDKVAEHAAEVEKLKANPQ